MFEAARSWLISRRAVLSAPDHDTGQIPSTLDSLTHLAEINLAQNRLTGEHEDALRNTDGWHRLIFHELDRARAYFSAWFRVICSDGSRRQNPLLGILRGTEASLADDSGKIMPRVHVYFQAMLPTKLATYDWKSLDGLNYQSRA